MVLDKNGTLRQNYSCIKRGIYLPQLQRWFKYFPRKQFLILDSSELQKYPFHTLKKVEQFLNLPNYFTDDNFVYNKAKSFYCFKSRKGNKQCLNSSKGRDHPHVPEELLKQLEDYYSSFNKELFHYLNINFTWINKYNVLYACVSFLTF